jgi:hypothetical protein
MVSKQDIHLIKQPAHNRPTANRHTPLEAKNTIDMPKHLNPLNKRSIRKSSMDPLHQPIIRNPKSLTIHIHNVSKADLLLHISPLEEAYFPRADRAGPIVKQLNSALTVIARHFENTPRKSLLPEIKTISL